MRRGHSGITDGSGWAAAGAGALVVALALAACGGSGTEAGVRQEGLAGGAPVHGKRGGKLTVLWTDDVDSIDCGQTYYQTGVFVCSATQRALYGYRPDDGTHMVPDLAAGPPRVSPDGRTVTVRIRPGVRFSPPVGREVTSRDVRYAIERGFFRTVQNGYAGTYFGDIEGAKGGVAPGTRIPGIETPDARTLVLHLTRPTGGVLAAGALAMYLTAPVPEEYARRFDRRQPSDYGTHQIATGPYRIAADAAGRAIGYEPGQRVHLVRNPSWNQATDFKPAYVDEIDNLEGNDTTVASRRILAGRSMVNGDFSPAPAVLERALRRTPRQLALIPSGGGRWIALNTKLPPFDDLNVRRAVLAGFDREALQRTRGGRLVGDVATHFLPPGIAGFQQAGGRRGPQLDFLAPDGRPRPKVSAAYFRRAGYPSGRYTGDEELLMVGAAGGVDQSTAEIAKAQLERMGFKVRLRLVSQDVMYTRFCGVPAARVNVCPNVGYQKDFADGQTLLDPTFNGDRILPQANSNWSQLDVPAINAAMARAEELIAPAARAAAWAAVDRAVTAQAPAVPWVWDADPLIESANVRGVASRFNAMWDVAWTSLR